MEHDADESEIEHLKKQTLDKNERGGFEQIVMWSRIVCIKIEIYSYSMDTQTVDVDEFMQEKSASCYFIATKANGENKKTIMT
eukprot:11098371-Heterocapsa_arctica.AAC.1